MRACAIPFFKRAVKITIDIVLSAGVEYDVKYSLGRQVSSLKPAPPCKELLTIRHLTVNVYMKRSSSAAKLPQAMSMKPYLSPY